MTTFESTRALLQPTFESYRLSSDLISVHAAALPVPTAPVASTSTANAESLRAWKDLRSRARWNHLTAGHDDGEVVWIEAAQGEVWRARFAKQVRRHSDLVPGDRLRAEQGRPQIGKLFDIPPLASSDAISESPTICAAGPGRFAFTDGQGTLHLITSAGQHLSAAHLSLDGRPAPFRLHAVDADSRTGLLSVNAPRPDGAKSPAHYDVVVVTLMADGALDQGQLDVLGRWRGDDLPVYARYDAAASHWIVGADSPYAVYPPVEAAAEPAPAEDPQAEPPRVAAPYSWTQTGDSVEIDLSTLPSALKATDFKISFSPQFISVLIAAVDSPRFAHRQLWAPVDAGACTWTWEPADGLLSIHLEKADVGTRWTTLFSARPEEGEVAETLTSEQLASITASLDKYTDEGDAPLDLDARASMLGEEEDDVDEETAEATVLTTLVPLPISTERVTLVSTALPRIGTPSNSLLVKRSYDALLYEPASDSGQWQHTSTFPALAFVLASKRHLRYRFHLGPHFALALEGGGPAMQAGGSNVYVYWPPAPGARAKHAVQAVASLSGAIVRGAVAIDEDRVAVLCEGELAVLSGFANPSQVGP
jgi:hypothetical protein